jgi:AAA+ superfamily predicted ATPase
MNNNVKQLISAVADNDMKEAKKYIELILASDKAYCNRGFVNHIRNKLSTTVEMVELPYDIKGMLSIQDVSLIFENDRYVVNDEDNAIFKQVMDIWNTNEKLIEYGIHYINSLLLHGESGCGKTMFGKYIAHKAGLPFAYLNFSNLISSYLGKTGENIEKVFNYVSNIKCVFMLDEVDAIGLARGGEDVGEMSRIVINLMQCLDKLNTGTIVIGATNRESDLDKALKRRFSIKHEMKLPTRKIRQEIIHVLD